MLAADDADRLGWLARIHTHTREHPRKLIVHIRTQCLLDKLPGKPSDSFR